MFCKVARKYRKLENNQGALKVLEKIIFALGFDFSSKIMTIQNRRNCMNKRKHDKTSHGWE